MVHPDGGMQQNGGARTRLKEIRAVTYCVPDLQAIEHAYTRDLGYAVAARSRIALSEARSWRAPAMQGCAALILSPRSGETVYLRFIEDPAAAGWRALQTLGWNVTEFVVQDVEALARRLERSAFEIIGAPKPLTRFPMIRAMQAIGPAGEACYFTQVGAGSGLDLAQARTFVGRVFIVVAAARHFEEAVAPYRAFENQVDAPVATPVTVISRAYGLPPGTLHRHGLVRLGEGTLIELDEYPPSARARARGEGRLPPGMAVVSFAVDSLGEHAFVGPPGNSGLPGAGLVASLQGGAGELIELHAPHGG